ncbi:hypothetical protein [Microcoleus sp. bin38.metabat.b11b12b14.051]|uniref:hypothetical protein n=1 Tax=Microcoleus sp. bin38.metabat.b11b12b14.051 TaxID=2742709 RepID=UPI0025F1E822|nr:hypothetical protein [Microcoleus sp. bin38.metabat.b11b12b14.051]
MNLKQNFHKQIAESLFPGNRSEEKACLLRRFAPENHPDNRVSTHKAIAKLMGEDLVVYCENKINQTIRKVIEVIVQRYGEEMKGDGVNTEVLVNLKPGGKRDKESEQKISPWKEVYKWLWNYKFLRWIDMNGWSILKERAKIAPNWLQFLTKEEMASVQRGTRAVVLPPPPPAVQKITPTIPAEKSLWMVIYLEFDNSQLLLLNRSQDGEFLLCPSSAYAPHPIIEKPPILLPQKDSWADQDESKTNFKFGKLVKEEFLAIALEKPVSLPWLIPREEEALPEWNAERLKELFEQLEKQDNWQVFYQSFEVVEK